MYSNKLDLEDIFSKIDYGIAILKMSPDFPQYTAGSDIDILHFHNSHIIEDLNRLLPLTRIDKAPGWVQLDYMVDGKLDLKFDLFTEVISPKFTDDLLLTYTTAGRNGRIYFVPSPLFDGMLKCYEFLKEPIRKKKHAAFIKYKDQLDEYTH